MDCSAFEHWLDIGQPRDDGPRAFSHAERCARCRASLAAARELDDALSRRFATAPDAFTDRVMARLPARERVTPAIDPLVEEPVFPLWVRVVQEPLTLISFLVGALFLGFGTTIWNRGVALFSTLESEVEGGLFSRVDQIVGSMPALPQWLLSTGLLVPALALAWFLYRTLTVREAGPGRG